VSDDVQHTRMSRRSGIRFADKDMRQRENLRHIPKLNKHLNVHAPFIRAYPWLSAQTLGVSKYVDAIVAMTPIVMAASAKLNTANDQVL
jgi:hypothetical protein